MSDREELDALRRLAELEAKAGGPMTPSMRRGENPAERMQKAPDPSVYYKVPMIAAGRQFDRLGAGMQEAGLSANVAGREAMGMPSGDQLRALAALDQEQKQKAAEYQPLREKHPFLTGIGETLFTAATPVGQTTALGRVAAPALVSAAQEALSYGSPKERAMGALEKGAMGAIGGAAGEGVRAIVSPAKSTLSAAQQQALKNASEKIGYIPRASELTGNETLARIEDMVARQPGGSGPMRDLANQNRTAVNRYLAAGIGEQANDLSNPVLANAADRIGETYDKLRGRAQMPVVQEIFDGIGKAEKLLTRGDMDGPKETAYQMIQRLKDQLYQAKEFDGATYQAWTSDLASKARTLGKENRTAAAALREVEKAMDKVARGADAPEWAKTDKQNALLELLMKPGIVEGGNASPVRIAGAMERQFGKNLKTGKVQGPAVDVAELGRYLPPMREGSQTAGREAYAGLPGWLMAVPNYAAAKTLTSQFGRDYLSQGLLGNPAISGAAGGLLGKGMIPLSIAELEAQLLGYQ